MKTQLRTGMVDVPLGYEFATHIPFCYIYIHMKLLDLLTENTNEPRVKYFGVPYGYNGSPEDHKMIKKMVNVYRAFSKGRGLVQIYHGDNHPPLDVSYELPPLNTVAILIDYPSNRALKNGGEIDYAFDVVGKVKYTLHNFETQYDTDIDRFMMHRGHDMSFVYKRKFDNFGVDISSS